MMSHRHAPAMLRDPEQERIGRKIRRQGKAKAREKGRARAADVPLYGLSAVKPYDGEVVRIANPIQPSVILLTWCSTCRQYMLEGSYVLRFCRSCGTPHPLPAGLPG